MDELELQISSGSSFKEKLQQFKRCEDLKRSIVDHERRLQALHYTIAMKPNYDIDPLRRIAKKNDKIWYSHREKA